MRSGSVARRYAKALYELARDEQNVAEIGESLKGLAQGVDQAGRDQVGRGVLDAATRQRIGEALAERVGRDALLGRFLRLVTERDRLGELPSILEWYERFEDRDAGRVRLEIITPLGLSDAEITGVCNAFRDVAGGAVLAHVSIDPSLLAGAVVELQGRVFDGSVKTALTRLASRMAGRMNESGS